MTHVKKFKHYLVDIIFEGIKETASVYASDIADIAWIFKPGTLIMDIRDVAKPVNN